ncbi:MAG TPA: hypothetical protein PKE64_25095 [Anaerolineae bacterium]|nr:hypothetical protein [Anaerolineae bacterium]HMR67302.1 hypothetical protein [Anaerolineae bacterium]
MRSNFKPTYLEEIYDEPRVDSPVDQPDPPSQVRVLLGRAAMTYAGLFLVAATGLSLLGVDPLFHQGLMPKTLLILVGLAVGLAMVNPPETLLIEQARSTLALAYRGKTRK